MKSKVAQGAAIGAAAALAAVALQLAGALDWLENPTWDWRVRTLGGPGAATPRVRLVLLDQGSLDWGAEEERQWPWPWPREIYGAALDFCRRGGAKAVIFDMLYTEPSVHVGGDDERFGQAIARAGAFYGTVFLSYEKGAAAWPAGLARPNAPPAEDAAFHDAGLVARATVPFATFPIPDVATNAAGLGNVHGQVEKDAVIRRIAPFRVFDGSVVPALALAPLFRAAPTNDPPRVLARGLRLAGRTIPLDRDGKLILRYRGPTQTHAALNAAAVVQSELRLLEGGRPTVDPAFFKDSYVLFGVTAPALLDLRPTPFSRVYPGVEIQATLLDNVLSGDFLRDAPLAAWALLTAALSVLAATATRCSSTGTRTALAFVGFAAVPPLLGLAAYPAGFWLPVAVQEAGVGVALVAAVIVNYALEGRQKRFIKGAFRQYLSPAVIDQLVRNPGQLRLGGEARELSIYFSDVQGFTGISESLGPEALTSLLNEYLTAMTDVILASGGTIDKYEGDAIIAFWNAPLPQDDHPLRAVRAALECQRRLAELRPALAERYGHRVVCRIGLNTGRVVVGNMGSNQRFDYTFLGDAGNLASRLEGINKQFGTPILVSEAMQARLGGAVATREISRVRVVGRREPVRVFEPLQPEHAAAARDALAVFADGLQRYYAGAFAAAAERFAALEEQDPTARAYLARCRTLAAAPPAPWDGVWTMTEK